MKKKVFMLSLLPLLGMGVVGCTSGSDANKAEIALVTDVGQLMDGSFNQGTWEGVEAYAKANKKTYANYIPKSSEESDRVIAMNNALDNGAKVIVCPGFLVASTLRKVAPQNPDVKFIFVDGWNVTDKTDKDGNDTGEVIKNVHGLSYKEHESGYMAGYAAVKEGYKKLAGSFGGGGTNAAVNRFAYGYVQGINDAAAGVDGVEVKMSYKNGATYSASDVLKQQISSWYSSGTEVVFTCGGGMSGSVIAAANEVSETDTKKAKVIGVDVDMYSQSNRIITSATKGLSASVQLVLKQIDEGKWDSDLAGKSQQLGAKEDSTGIAFHSDRLTKFKEADYNALLGKVKDGSITIKSDTQASMDDKTLWETTINGQLANINIVFD